MITKEIKNPPVGKSGQSATIGAVLLCGLFQFQPTLAQDAGTVTVDVAHCLDLESNSARSDCFSAQVNTALDESGAAQTVPIVPNEPRRLENEPQNTAERNALVSAEQPEIDQPAQTGFERESENEEIEFFGTIVAIRERLPSSYIITLDNGQVWQQTEPKQYFLRPGMQVRIYPTRWGQRYRLSGVGSGGHIQVQRLR